MSECVLCGTTIGRNTQSRQHVFPDWLEPFFISADKKSETIPYHRRMKRRGESMRYEQWDDIPFNLRVKALCKPCNNEWCNEIETAAQPLLIPMITGNAINLSAVNQETVAIWAT